MTRYFNLLASVAVSSALFIAGANASAQTHEHAGPEMASATPGAADTALSVGEIKKIDKDTGKLTIQHGPLTNLNMPGMTMVFKAQNPSMLEQVKVGDNIHFQAENVNGSLTVTRLESAK
jgi:Cu/Ag efflux protein CusF